VGILTLVKRRLVYIFIAAAIAVVLVLLLPRCIRVVDRGHYEFDGQTLVSVPYAGPASSTDPTKMGVTIHERDLTSGGYNLFASRQLSEAYLMDMDGRIVHVWSYPDRVEPDEVWKRDYGNVSARFERCWEALHLCENGDLVVACRFSEVLVLDWNSRILWQTKICAHHDISPSGRGTFYVPAKDEKEHRGLRVRFAYIAEISPGTDPETIWSTYDKLDEIKAAFATNMFLDTQIDNGTFQPAGIFNNRSLVSESDGALYDYFHLNSVELVGDNPHREDRRFRPDNLLVCCRNIDQIAVLDGRTMEILWTWGEDELEWPHHPTMLDTGNILVFDNGVRCKRSRIIEVDPIEEIIVWEYEGNSPGSFYSSHKGSAQRLPDGNTLICDGQIGRAFEITPDKQVVWEFYLPVLNKRGERSTIYRMTRYPAEMIDKLRDRHDDFARDRAQK
jgi:hypothetical protein